MPLDFDNATESGIFAILLFLMILPVLMVVALVRWALRWDYES